MVHEHARFRSRRSRVRYALHHYHGIGEEMSKEEIADELNVTVHTVRSYLNDSDMAAQMRDVQRELEKQTHQQLVEDYQSRLDTLYDLEEQLIDVVEPAVTGYEMKEVKSQVTDYESDEISLDITDENPEDMDVPVPSRFEEVPSMRRLKDVWEEMSRVQEQLEDLLGLEEPEQHNVTGEVTENKVMTFTTDVDDSLPEQEVTEIDEDVDDE